MINLFLPFRFLLKVPAARFIGRGRMIIGLGLLCCFGAGLGQAADPAISLALVARDPSLSKILDLLTVELSKKEGLTLLERSQIDKIIAEQKLTAAGMAGENSIKIGRLLGADGLVLLEINQEGTNQVLSVRLVAVQPGVGLTVFNSPWPLKGSTESNFWNGSYLLEGSIDRDGYSPQTMTVHATLAPASGGNRLAIEATGRRQDLKGLVEKLLLRFDWNGDKKLNPEELKTMTSREIFYSSSSFLNFDGRDRRPEEEEPDLVGLEKMLKIITRRSIVQRPFRRNELGNEDALFKESLAALWKGDSAKRSVSPDKNAVLKGPTSSP